MPLTDADLHAAATAAVEARLRDRLKGRAAGVSLAPGRVWPRPAVVKAATLQQLDVVAAAPADLMPDVQEAVVGVWSGGPVRQANLADTIDAGDGTRADVFSLLVAPAWVPPRVPGTPTPAVPPVPTPLTPPTPSH